MKPWANCKRWTFIHGSDMDPDIYAKLPPEVDVLFIDTSHEYQHTLDELDAYVPRVVKGGVVLLHDTQFLFTRPGEIHDGSIPPVTEHWTSSAGKLDGNGQIFLKVTAWGFFT